MLDVKFSYNWNNKLDCRAFTTLRIYNPHIHFANNPVKLWLKDQEIGTGRFAAVNPFLLANMSPFISFLDMGYNVPEATAVIVKMYPKIDFTVKRIALLLIVKDVAR